MSSASSFSEGCECDSGLVCSLIVKKTSPLVPVVFQIFIRQTGSRPNRGGPLGFVATGSTPTSPPSGRSTAGIPRALPAAADRPYLPEQTARRRFRPTDPATITMIRRADRRPAGPAAQRSTRIGTATRQPRVRSKPKPFKRPGNGQSVLVRPSHAKDHPEPPSRTSRGWTGPVEACACQWRPKQRQGG